MNLFRVLDTDGKFMLAEAQISKKSLSMVHVAGQWKYYKNPLIQRQVNKENSLAPYKIYLSDKATTYACLWLPNC